MRASVNFTHKSNTTIILTRFLLKGLVGGAAEDAAGEDAAGEDETCEAADNEISASPV